MPVAGVALILLTAAIPVLAGGGMHPIADLEGLDWAATGLELTARDIFDPTGASLIDAVCTIGDGSGCFVSADGLILTNHHCVFAAIQAASDPGRDLLIDGFLARSRADEVPARGYVVRIAEGQRDVSAEVLAAATSATDPRQRALAVETCRAEIARAAEAAIPGVRAEVSELVIGRRYVLFTYRELEDVRLVYAPPVDVADFGGAAANWSWPRHAGDFALLRAYVAPGGSSRRFDPANVPFRPRRHLRVAADGAAIGDAIAILGFPARTQRMRSAAFLRHEAAVRLPWFIDWRGWQVALLEEASARRPADRRRLANRLKRLRNQHKSLLGAREGLRRRDLVARRAAADRELAAWIAAAPDRERRFGHVLPALAAFHAERDTIGPGCWWLDELMTSSWSLALASTIHEAARERQRPDRERRPPYRDRAIARTLQRLADRAPSIVPEVERELLRELLLRGGSLPASDVPDPLRSLVGIAGAERAAEWVDEALALTQVSDPDWCLEAARMSPEEQARLGDPFLALVAQVEPDRQRLRQRKQHDRGQLMPLLADLFAAREGQRGRALVPDADRTLRLSPGTIAGYRGYDGSWQDPVTTIAGLLARDRGRPPYRLPARVRERIAPRHHDTPVCLLYSADTAGGSSGSPVLDARGRLVALHFDRPWEATVSDHVWDPDQGRSIGVDVRYIAWMMGVVDGAADLLAEMGLETPE
jgi:hypothetical protein